MGRRPAGTELRQIDRLIELQESQLTDARAAVIEAENERDRRMKRMGILDEQLTELLESLDK